MIQHWHFPNTRKHGKIFFFFFQNVTKRNVNGDLPCTFYTFHSEYSASLFILVNLNFLYIRNNYYSNDYEVEIPFRSVEIDFRPDLLKVLINNKNQQTNDKI